MATVRQIGALLAAAILCVAVAAPSVKHPELGDVKWGRDLDAALRKSKESGKPVLLLFQEVPG